MLIGYKVFRERFTSKVTLSFPNKIEAVYSDGPFKYLINRWEFIEDDELIEVTPEAIRVRKRILDANQRKKAAKQNH